MAAKNGTKWRISWIGFWRPAFGWPDIQVGSERGSSECRFVPPTSWFFNRRGCPCVTPGASTYIVRGGRYGIFFLWKEWFLIDESPFFVVAGRRFRGGIRTTGPSHNLCDYGSSNTHAHTGTILSIYLSLSVHHRFESPIPNNNVFTYTCSFFVATGAPSSVVHVQQTSSEMVAIYRYQGEVGVIDSVYRVPTPFSAGEFR